MGLTSESVVNTVHTNTTLKLYTLYVPAVFVENKRGTYNF